MAKSRRRPGKIQAPKQLQPANTPAQKQIRKGKTRKGK